MNNSKESLPVLREGFFVCKEGLSRYLFGQ